MRSATTRFGIKTVANIYTGTIASVADLAAMPAGTWGEVLNSPMTAAEKPANQYSDWNGSSSSSYNANQGNLGFSGGFLAWVGGAADTLRGRLLVGMGGGHNAYAGNEVLVFDPGIAFAWDRLTDPSEVGGLLCSNAYPDGQPAARHTYGAPAYSEGRDEYYIGTGAPACTVGIGSNQAIRLPLSAMTGNRVTNGDEWVFSAAVLSDTANTGGYVDSRLDRYNYLNPTSPQQHISWNVATNTWTNLDPGGNNGNTQGSEVIYNPDNQVAWGVGSGAFDEWDLSDSGYSAGAPLSSPGFAGPSAVVNSSLPGIDWNPDLNRAFCWVGGTTVYSVDNSRVFRAHPPAASNLASPPAFPSTTQSALYGRWRYLPAYGVYILAANVSDNVFFYKPTLAI